MPNYFLPLIVAMSLILSGCEEYKYIVKMIPTPKGIKRTVTVAGNLPKPDRARLEKVYEQPVEPNVYQGTFNNYLPSDIGGQGYYTSVSSPLGSTYYYSERFRGTDDVNATTSHLLTAADRYIDFAVGFLRSELGSEPNFPRLENFCNTQLRSDIKNLALYFYLFGIVSDFNSAAPGKESARLLQGALERNYYPLSQQLALTQNSDEFYPVMQSIAARQLGLSEKDAKKKLAFLSSSDSLQNSLERYLPHSTIYRQLKSREPNDPNARVKTEDVLVALGTPELFDPMRSDSYKLELSLACRAKPYETNGSFDANTCEVSWNTKIADPMHLPTFAYAMWSEPNESFQKSRFGSVILKDKTLARYCTLRQDLSPEHLAKWDSFIYSLDPTADIKTAVSAFGLTQPTGPDPVSSLRGLVLSALNAADPNSRK